MIAETNPATVIGVVTAILVTSAAGMWQWRTAREARKPADAVAAFHGYQTLVAQLQEQVDRLERTAAADRKRCDEELATLHHEVAELRRQLEQKEDRT